MTYYDYDLKDNFLKQLYNHQEFHTYDNFKFGVFSKHPPIEVKGYISTLRIDGYIDFEDGDVPRFKINRKGKRFYRSGGYRGKVLSKRTPENQDEYDALMATKSNISGVRNSKIANIIAVIATVLSGVSLYFSIIQFNDIQELEQKNNVLNKKIETQTNRVDSLNNYLFELTEENKKLLNEVKSNLADTLIKVH